MDQQTLEVMLEELDRVDRRAYGMALELLDTPLPRPDLVYEAAGLAERLVSIAEELRVNAPQTRQRRASQISEATMDLDHVQGKTRFMSRRVGRRYLDRRRP
jgi:hypothetical protein